MFIIVTYLANIFVDCWCCF